MSQTMETLTDPVCPVATDTAKAERTFHETLDRACDAWIDAVQHGRSVKRDLLEDFDSAFNKRPMASVAGGIVLGALLGSLVGWSVCRRS